MSRLRLCPSCNTVQKDMFQYKELNTCSHVYLRQIAIAPPLTAPYDGPYKVISRSGRIMKILIKGKVATILIDRVKPAHWLPDQSNDVERKTLKKTTNFKTAGIFRGTQRDPAVKLLRGQFGRGSNRTRVPKVFDTNHWFKSRGHSTVPSD